jgi:hypothetical protein
VKVLNEQIRTKHRLSTTKKKEKSHEKNNKTNITITQQEKKRKLISIAYQYIPPIYMNKHFKKEKNISCLDMAVSEQKAKN